MRAGRPTGRANRLTCVAKYSERPYTKNDTLSRVWQKRCSNNTWRGYIGNWHLNVGQPDESVIKAMRSFKWRDATHQVMDLIVVSDSPRPGATQRAEDSNYESRFFFDYSNPEALAQGVLVNPGDKDQHLLALDADAYVNAAMSLPALGGAGMWGFEVFLHDGDCRWSAIVLYDAKYGDLKRVSLIQEYYTDIKPSSPHVVQLASSRIREPREPLAGEPSSWVDPKSPGGRRLKLVRGDGGDRCIHAVEGPQPVVWQAPGCGPSASMTSTLMLLPDAMYIHLPATLALAGPEEPFRLEFGGQLRDALGSFARVVIDYDSDGLLSSVCRDLFVRGSYEEA